MYSFLTQLDGTRDVETLRRHAPHDFPDLARDVTDVIAALPAGVVVDATSTPSARQPNIRLQHDPGAAAVAVTIGDALSDLGLAVGPEPDLTLVLSTGEPRRADIAGLVRVGHPHLPVILDGDAVRVGPWVVPGTTPCLECADWHRAGWDPTWAALVPQFGRPARPGISPSVRLGTASLVVAELERFAAGVRPRTWMTVLLVSPGPTIAVVSESVFHPRCACTVLLAA